MHNHLDRQMLEIEIKGNKSGKGQGRLYHTDHTVNAFKILFGTATQKSFDRGGLGQRKLPLEGHLKTPLESHMTLFHFS